MKLALFFTRNVSLQMWADLGLLDREKSLYEEHLRLGHLKKVYWLTYGAHDAELAHKLKKNKRLHADIEVLPMPSFFHGKWGRALYSFLMPYIHRRKLQSADIFKTNQMDGSWSAVIAKRTIHKPLLLRTGYTLTQLEHKINHSNTIRNKLFEIAERIAYKRANLSVVSSRHDKNYLISKYNIDNSLIHVIHNYIDINLFTPTNQKRYNDRIIFVGRLTKEKNLFNLIKALSKTELILDIYGQGNLQNELEQIAKQKGVVVNFKGMVANDRLPDILNSYRYYILPSLSEGMPKTLLEAMACGCVCVGTDVVGINEVIDDGRTGYLAKSIDPESIYNAIFRAMLSSNNDSIINSSISRIKAQFSLATVCRAEYQIFNRI